MWEVIDLVYLEDEGNVVFQGTQEESVHGENCSLRSGNRTHGA